MAVLVLRSHAFVAGSNFLEKHGRHRPYRLFRFSVGQPCCLNLLLAECLRPAQQAAEDADARVGAGAGVNQKESASRAAPNAEVTTLRPGTWRAPAYHHFRGGSWATGFLLVGSGSNSGRLIFARFCCFLWSLHNK